MQLFVPTKVYSETDCVAHHAAEIAGFGRRAMLVTGASSAKKTGALDDVCAALEQQGVDWVLFDEIEENPSVETVMRARAIGLRSGVDFVIGIGGGSPMDAAKAIALMIANPGETAQVLYQARALPCLPVLCVPTTCGTGSEVTPYAILTLHETRTKKSISHRIFPVLALLDAKYLATMPRSGLVNTCVDALAHLVESYLNSNSNALNRVYSEAGLRLWAQFRDELRDGAPAAESYAAMLHASMIAGMAIAHTGTSLPHGLSYPVTYELGVPHGKAVGMFLGGYVEQYVDRAEADTVVRLLGFAQASELRGYLRELLGVVEVSDTLLQRCAALLMADPAKRKNCPFPVTEEMLLQMAN